MAKQIHFRTRCCQKFTFPNNLPVKVVHDSISYKKVTGRICPSSTGVKQGGSKDCHLQNTKMYKNGENDSLQCSTLPKIYIISKKASKKVVHTLVSYKKVSVCICLKKIFSKTRSAILKICPHFIDYKNYRKIVLTVFKVILKFFSKFP